MLNLPMLIIIYVGYNLLNGLIISTDHLIGHGEKPWLETKEAILHGLDSASET